MSKIASLLVAWSTGWLKNIEISAVWYHWFAVWGPHVFVSYILFVNLQKEVVVFFKMRVCPPLKNVDQHTHTHTQFFHPPFFLNMFRVKRGTHLSLNRELVVSCCRGLYANPLIDLPFETNSPTENSPAKNSEVFAVFSSFPSCNFH